jgi:hypothetical protein
MKRGLFVNLHGRQLGQLIEKQKKKTSEQYFEKKRRQNRSKAKS